VSQSLDRLNEAHGLFWHAAGNPHAVGQTKRRAIAHDESLTQERTPERCCVTNPNQEEIRLRRLHVKAETCQQASASAAIR
jgi:hypothetical protein